MKKIQLLADPNRTKFCSTDIIVSQLNEAAKKIGVYSDNEYSIVYDCIGQKYGYKPDAMLIVYEFVFPKFMINSAWPKPILGVSRDNLSFIRDAGYPEELSDYFPLGVDSELWRFKNKNTNNDKFILLGIGECNTRGGLDLIVSNFCLEFTNSKNIILYLRDRSASEKFKNWVKMMAEKFNVIIQHDDRHLENFEEERDIYYQADAAICLNKSSTWNLRTIECMSTGTPLIVIPYGGPRDYSTDNISAIHVEYDLSPLTLDTLQYLEYEIGLRNHLFNPNVHSKTPMWTLPKSDSIRKCMRNVFEDYSLREKISIGGAEQAKYFSWENSVLKLIECMDKFI
jgi:glycosyltransferase involved in cell wall biosynthesis